MKVHRATVAAVLAWAVALAASTASAQRVEKYWVYFSDKPSAALPKAGDRQRLAEKLLSPRAIQRRLKVRSPQALIDFSDLPVDNSYVEALRQRGLEVVTLSKWLNAVSVLMSPEQVEWVKALPFVKRVTPVAKFRRGPQPPEPAPELPKGWLPQGRHRLDYGPSLTQNAMIHVPEVHDLGLSGRGVLITMLDTGFNLNHEALRSVNVMAQRDFINKDNNTADEPGQDFPGQESHGTSTLSIIGGFKSGQLIGPAYGATFALAKTEYVPTETPIEEDYWVAGIEWADSLGADIVSSSLGYSTWDDGTGYTPADMNGDVAVTTVAADLAASKGIVVVSSAGNEGSSTWRIITAPADGDSVIAVGAVDASGQLASFSSTGPTADGRIKPDVVAMGVGDYVASHTGPTAYYRGSGTSFSCPLVAGVCALMLEAHPQLMPVQVREALRQTANRAAKPDTLYGWGLVDALGAVRYYGPVTIPPKPEIPERFRLYPNYPNPFNATTLIRYDLPESSHVTLKVYNILGQEVVTLLDDFRIAGTQHGVLWDGRDEQGQRMPSGLYVYRLRAGRFAESQRMVLSK